MIFVCKEKKQDTRQTHTSYNAQDLDEQSHAQEANTSRRVARTPSSTQQPNRTYR